MSLLNYWLIMFLFFFYIGVYSILSFSAIKLILLYFLIMLQWTRYVFTTGMIATYSRYVNCLIEGKKIKRYYFTMTAESIIEIQSLICYEQEYISSGWHTGLCYELLINCTRYQLTANNDYHYTEVHEHTLSVSLLSSLRKRIAAMAYTTNRAITVP